eukprot:CAMPEP_0117074214 /NCGR_PEP_ID=MMETSP0472-20121206/52282_1 /TAXON_ID=693140 ORGANISM="Tiarina fusus, Strain LIS" /NCGR_SAMPLE_ID=MMETSP0472 /ASSEMBLY_ACC=CAM_ASM_000603 /LENGTH=974 /DNA_ID=CAMNT_0004799135 /DNA_START=4736 /DNA_END=7660 /DNA_ORIENTATION=+
MTDDVPLTAGDLEDEYGEESDSESSMIVDNSKPADGSHIIQFLDEYLRLIPALAYNWRTFAQYFLVLQSFAEQGLPQKQYLLDLSVCSSLIDFFMVDDNQSSKKDEQPALPSKFLGRINITHMIDFLAEVVCSCHTTGSLQAEIKGQSLYLGEDDKDRLYNPEFYVKALRAKQDTENICKMLVRLMCLDKEFSLQLIGALTSKLYELKRDELLQFGKVLWEAIQLDDSLHPWRLHKAMSLIFTTINKYDGKVPTVTPMLIKKIAEWCKLDKLVCKFVFDNINFWLFPWLVHADLEQTRDACEHLLAALLPSLDDDLDDIPGTPQSPSIDPTELEKRCDEVFQMLLSFLPNAKDYSSKVLNPSGSLEPNSPWHLAGYFRLFKYLTKTSDHVDMIMEKGDCMLEQFEAIGSHNNELDMDKYEMLSWWNGMIDIDNSLVQFLTGKPDKEIVLLLQCFFCLRDKDVCIDYTRKTFSAFYSVLFRCCQYKDHFLDILLTHQNFIWAVEYIYLSPLYLVESDWIYSILKLAVEKKSDTSYRSLLINRIIESSDNSFSSRNALKILDLLLRSADDINIFCSHNGPETICNYPELSDGPGSPKLDDVHPISNGLNILVKTTTFLLLEPETKQHLVLDWENKLSLLPVLRKYLHYFQEPQLLQQCFKLLFNLASLDNPFFENLIQCLYQEHDKYNEQRNQPSKKHYALEKPSVKLRDYPEAPNGKHEGYYEFLAQICAGALEIGTIHDCHLINTVLSLLILGAMETLRKPTVSRLFVNLLQNVWDYQYYNQLLRSNGLVDSLITQAMLNCRLSDELFVFVKSVLPEIRDRLSPESKKSIGFNAAKLLGVCLSASREATPVAGLDNGIVDFVKIGILCTQDEIMKLELAPKANEMRELFQYVTTQAELFKKISQGIEQLTVAYSLRDVHHLVPVASNQNPVPTQPVAPPEQSAENSNSTQSSEDEPMLQTSAEDVVMAQSPTEQ